MTAKPEDLICLLRGRSTPIDSSEAADLIEKLLAENARSLTYGRLMRADLKTAEHDLDRMLDISKKQKAQNRRLQDELEKTKAELGARNRILTEEP